MDNDTVSRISLLMSEGNVDEARKLAYRTIFTSPHRNEIVRMLRADKPDNTRCKCGATLTPIFNNLTLRYREADQCDECIQKEMEHRRQQAEKADRRAHDRFLDQKPEEVSAIMRNAGVPGLFLNANTQSNTALDKDNLFITGGVGVGKTYMAASILRKHIDGMPVCKRGDGYYINTFESLPIFINVADLLLDIRSCFSQNSTQDERGLIEKYTNAPLLVMDDLGVEKTTDWALQTLYMVVNKRSTDTARQTVITSNLSLGMIGEKLDERIASRIKGMCKVIKLEGKDRRVF